MRVLLSLLLFLMQFPFPGGHSANGGGGGGISFVSGNGGGACVTFAASGSCSISITAGQFVYISAMTDTGTLAVSDNGTSGGNTYTQIGTTNTLGGVSMGDFVTCATKSATSVTVTTGGSGAVVRIASLVASGVSSCTPTGTGGKNGDTSGTQTSLVLTPATFSTTAGSLVVAAGWALGNTLKPVAGYDCAITGYTVGSGNACTDAGSAFHGIIYKIESTTTAQPAATQGAAQNWSLNGFSVK